jgi:hypothetical protein
LAAAALLLTLFILPAEYGVDVTGVGRVLGLTELAAQPTDAPAAPRIAAEKKQWAFESIREEIVLGPREGVEFKFDMQAGEKLLFFWSATRSLYYDFHGEPTTDAGKAFLPFKSYWIASDSMSGGTLTTEFAGKHGWFWRNDGREPVTITLVAAGYYKVIGEINRSKMDLFR